MSTSKSEKSIVKLWKLSDHHWLMGIQILCNIYLAGVTIYVSRLAQRSIDENLIVAKPYEVIGLLALVGLTGIIVSGLCTNVSGKYAINLTCQLKELSVDKISHCHYSYIENEHSGTIINKLTNDITTVSEYFAYSFPEVLRSGITFVCSFVYLLMVNWMMTLACTICIPVSLLIAKKFANPTYDTMEKFWGEMDEVAAMAKDTLSESKVEKAYNLQDVRRKQFDKKMNGATKLYVDFEILMAKSGAFKYLLRSAPTLICILVGFIAAYFGLVTGGAFAAFILMIRNISDPLSKVITYVTDYKEAQVSMDRIVDVLKLEEESESCANIAHTSDENACFEFKDVTFAYKESNVLEKLNGIIVKDKMTAIVGESGSGKSTLLKILEGFYSIDSGKIFMCGEGNRSQIAYVEQNSFLFNQTVAENIAVGRENATMKEIIEAAKMAYAHDFIMKLPQGYQTVLHEEGLNLSGGQRQRIAIARAFLKDAPILLLDEMTSALDAESEQLIKKSLNEYRLGRTVIVVAHRLSTIIDADEILVLDHGKFVERGTHQELLGRDGVYAQLYQRRECIKEGCE